MELWNSLSLKKHGDGGKFKVWEFRHLFSASRLCKYGRMDKTKKWNTPTLSNDGHSGSVKSGKSGIIGSSAKEVCKRCR